MLLFQSLARKRDREGKWGEDGGIVEERET
jgi:hypothetical protein